MTDAIPAFTRYPRLAGLLYNRPLMIHPEKLATIEQVFLRHVNGEGNNAELRPASERILDTQGLAVREGFTPDKPYVLTEGGTAVIPVIGTLVHRADSLDAMSGLLSYGRIISRLKNARENSQVRGILLEVDSGGGDLSGLFELADEIAATAEVKPIWSISNEDMFSAAYAIGSATQRITSPKTGMVGSVGVVMLHVDQSKMNESRGLTVTHIYAGAHKVDYSPHQPLSDEARSRAQELVDFHYGQFVEHVAVNRPMTEDQVRATEAGIFTIQEGVENGLADQVATLDDTVAELEASYGRRSSVAFLQTRSRRATTQEGSIMNLIQVINAAGMTAADQVNIQDALAKAGLDVEFVNAPPALTAENLGEHHPAIAETLQQRGATAERERIQAVREQSIAGYESLIAQLMFDGKTTGPEAAVQILNAEREKAGKRSADLDADAAAVNNVSQEEPGEEDAGVQPAAQGFTEEGCQADWDKNKGGCQQEFGSYETYRAYRKAEASGRVKILGRRKAS